MFSLNSNSNTTKNDVMVQKWWRSYANLEMEVSPTWTDGSPVTYYKPDSVPGFAALDGLYRYTLRAYQRNDSAEVAGDWFAFLVMRTQMKRNGDYDSDAAFLWVNYVISRSLPGSPVQTTYPKVPTICSGPVERVEIFSRRQNHQECPRHWHGSLCANISCGTFGWTNHYHPLGTKCICPRSITGRYCEKIPALPPFDPAINGTTQIRFVPISENPNNRHIGVPEALLNGSWTGIHYGSDRPYDKVTRQAVMLCRMLGFTSISDTDAEAFAYWLLPGDSQVGANLSDSMQAAYCTGREVDLSQCELDDGTPSNGRQQRYVTGVECGVTRSMRLVDEQGTDTTAFGSGYLEILNRGVWSKVCSNHNYGAFHAAQAALACTQLGFQSSNVTYSSPSLYCYHGGPDKYHIRNRFGASVMMRGRCSPDGGGLASDCQVLAVRDCNSCKVQLDCLGLQTVFTNPARPPFGYPTPNWYEWPTPSSVVVDQSSAVNATFRLIAPNGLIDIGYGRVEVNYNGSWGTICDDSWGTEETNVLCRSLGYNSTTPRPYGNAAYGHGNGSIHMDDLSCRGREGSLAECAHRGWGRHDCTHREDAGVDCTGNNPPSGSRSNSSFYRTTTQASIDGADVTVRLMTSGGTTNQTYGRVEVRVNGVWGTVCDDNWGPNEAKVVCTSMGFGETSGLKAVGYQRAHYGAGSGPVWLDNVNCTGSETSIAQCRHNGWGQHNCRHVEDAAVDCAVRSLPANFRHHSVVGLPPGIYYGKVDVSLTVDNQMVYRKACIRGMSSELQASMLCRSLGLPDFVTALHRTAPHYVPYEERHRYALIDDCGSQASVTLDQCRVSLGEDEAIGSPMLCGDAVVVACLGPPPGFDSEEGDSTEHYTTGGRNSASTAAHHPGEVMEQQHRHFFHPPELESDSNHNDASTPNPV